MGRTLLAFADEIARLRGMYPTFPQEMGVFVGQRRGSNACLRAHPSVVCTPLFGLARLTLCAHHPPPWPAR